MRIKRRYVMVESALPIGDREEFKRQFYRELLLVVGELGYHRVNPRIMRFIDDRRFVMKADLEGVSDAIRATALINRIGGQATAFYTLGSSGTIKALTKTAQGDA
ncbi:MAG: hypothetical protein LVQ97_01365 [Candidatus Micrarchaeales archaeon]|nr:hypothetical protein [Candidatus Micrarchaeales archaeon]